MQAVRNKIRSRRGASLTFALLLFLVCAVIGSVVLTAGTVAAGRMAQVAEMDQRYYSVNSAARLLIDLIDGKEVTIVEIIEKNDDGSTPSPEYKYSVDDDDTINPFALGSIVNEAAYNMVKADPSSTISPVTYSLELNDKSVDVIKVSVEEQLDKDGKMTLRVKSNDDKYSLKLMFNMDETKITDHQEKQDVITRKFAWHIRDIQIVGPERWVTPTP